MHAEQISEPAIGIDLDGLFTEAGVIPEGGGLWIVPTETFLRIWETAVGVVLRERGFRLAADGMALGASQECVVHIPVASLKELFCD